VFISQKNIFDAVLARDLKSIFFTNGSYPFISQKNIFDAVMECKTPRKSMDNSKLLAGTSKHNDNVKQKRTESPKQSIASEHFFASR